MPACLSVRVIQRARVLVQHDNRIAYMGTPVPSTGAKLLWRPSFGDFSWAVARKVTRHQGEITALGEPH